MGQCVEAEMSRLLTMVCTQRREQAMKFRFPFGRFACLKSYTMLQQCINEILMHSEQSLRPFQEQLSDWNGEFGYTDYGKPFMLNRSGSRIEGVDFSISHCKNAIAVVLSDRPVGVDVESFRHAEEALLRRTMNPEEQGEVRAAADPAEAFTRLWTRKEALLKLRGTGLVDDLHSVLIPNSEHPITLETTVNREKQYVWTLAY